MINRPAFENKPWYRHPWPWLLMAGPFIVVVAGLVTAYLAVVSNDGLVDDDYYKQGLAVNQISARDQRAAALALQAEVMRGADGAQIRILLRARSGTVLPGDSDCAWCTRPVPASIRSWSRSPMARGPTPASWARRCPAAGMSRLKTRRTNGA